MKINGVLNVFPLRLCVFASDFEFLTASQFIRRIAIRYGEEGVFCPTAL